MTIKIIYIFKMLLILSILSFMSNVMAALLDPGFDSGLTDSTYCYFKNESVNRPEGTDRSNTGKCTITNFPTEFCFYGVYDYIYYDQYGNIYPPSSDSEASLENMRTLLARDTDFHIILQFKSPYLAEVVSNYTACQTLLNNAFQLIDYYDFNGIDLYLDITMEYQKPLQDCLLLAKDVITGNGYRLAVSFLTDLGNIVILDPVFLSETVELIVMLHEYYNSSSTVAVPIAPLYALTTSETLPDGFDSTRNMEATVNAWLNAGVDPRKFIVTLSTSFLTFETETNDDPSVGQPVKGPGPPTPLTNTPGFAAYFEVCSNPNITLADRDGYAFGLNGMEGFAGGEFLRSIRAKAIFARNNNLKGVGMSNTCDDDFNNICGNGRNVIASTATSTAIFGNDPGAVTGPLGGRIAAEGASEVSELGSANDATIRSNPGISAIA